jgi:hypothetical protein
MFERQTMLRPKRRSAPAAESATRVDPFSAPISSPADETIFRTPATTPDFGSLSILPPESRTDPASDERAPALGDRIRARQGGGAPLALPVQRQMETGFGHSLADIRIHTDSEADTLSRSVDAHAFTTGRDIFFREGAYNPGSPSGQHLLAHEIAHTVQQASGPVAATPLPGGVAVSDPADPFERAAVRTADAVTTGQSASPAAGIGSESENPSALPIQRFGSKEHQEIGDAATGGESMLTMDIGDPQQPLSYGQVVALAGDYFESIEEMRALADPKNPEGQAQIRWAREDGMGIKATPPVSDAAATAAKNRYYSLAAKNFSHFSAGGTARNEYERVHQQALGEAFRAGLTGDPAKLSDAKVTEAFSNHYLTDMFSSGHVRTPRQEIKEWYQQKFPPDGGISKIVDYLAYYLTETLNDQGDIPWYWRKSWVRPDVREKVEELGGPAIKAYSLADIVGLAYHNYDNEHGLVVVSEAGPDGKTVPGGYVWPELDKGDSHLKDSPLTKEMAVAAVRDSVQDLTFMFDAAQHAGAGKCLTPDAIDAAAQTEIAGMQPPAAEKYIPREARKGDIMDSGTEPNVQFQWQWGSLDPVLRTAIDATVKGDIVEEMGKITPADMQLNRRGKPDPDGAIVLHVAQAFKTLIAHLASEGIKALEAAVDLPAVEKEEMPDIPPTDAGVPAAGVPLPEAAP